ncbi:universal stress protein [Sphingosinicella rhizophila]|uniref:Universal stress protein n=1 Tax=Sphingosinicella rhizophila TaxID=3050082 RepID=A0ABU3QCC5_9SPHN|nr:universal stress protein [Sphingosinicella sp. GR2756]MDT9601053.1 universal stress protein [Sphingosinicella sp. GR2756]
MDRILVATDFSTRSDRALRRATLIARRVGASLTVVHVVDADRPERLVAADQAAALSALEETAQTLRTGDEIAADPLVQVDDVHSGILNAAEQVGAHLIILGPHRSRLRDVFIGTTVERVVRRSRFPLLVAIQAPSASYERTLLALDFDEASKSAGRAALAMGIFERTDVVVMHAFDTPAEGMLRRAMDTTGAIDDYVASERGQAVEKLHGLVRALGLPSHDQRVAAINGTPARSILESARSQDAHLIVLGTNQRKGFERLLIGSVTEDVIRDAHRDVLIIPTDEG